MNINVLINLLLLNENEKNSDSVILKDYDIVSDLNNLRNSTDLCKNVINMLENEILPKVVNQIKNKNNFIELEIGLNSLFIKENGKITKEINYIKYFEEKKTEKYDYYCTFKYLSTVKDVYNEYSKFKNIVFSFRNIGDMDEEVIHHINQICNEIELCSENDMFIYKIERERMFKEIDYFDKSFFQYFLKCKTDYYFVKFKISDNLTNQAGSAEIHSDNPVIYFFLRRFKNIKNLKKIIQKFNKNINSKKSEKFFLYCYRKILEKKIQGCSIETFFDVYYKNEKTNNFESCVKFLYSQKDFRNVLNSFLKTISLDELNFLFDEKKLEFWYINTDFKDLYFFENLCLDFMSKIGISDRKNPDVSFDPEKYGSECPYITFKKFFCCYLYDYNRKYIKKYESELLEIMLSEIYQLLRQKFYLLRKSVFQMIMIYNRNQVQENFSDGNQKLNYISEEQKEFIKNFTKK